MDKKLILNMAASDCSPEKEEKYNKWYSEVHIPMIFKYKGMKKAARYKRIGDDEKHPRYLAVYQFESQEALDGFPKSPELIEAMKELEETWKDGGLDLQWVASYEPIKIWEKE